VAGTWYFANVPNVKSERIWTSVDSDALSSLRVAGQVAVSALVITGLLLISAVRTGISSQPWFVWEYLQFCALGSVGWSVMLILGLKSARAGGPDTAGRIMRGSIPLLNASCFVLLVNGFMELRLFALLIIGSLVVGTLWSLAKLSHFWELLLGLIVVLGTGLVSTLCWYLVVEMSMRTGAI
jgi:hypothetical protein